MQPYRDPNAQRPTVASVSMRDRAPAPARERAVSSVSAPSAPARPRTERPTGQGAQGQAFVTFQVSWGEEKGADVRRLLAILCRKGDVTSQDIGEIRVQQRSSAVDVHAAVADHFERSASKPDNRDPQVRVRRWAPPGAQKAAPKPKRQVVG